MKKYLLITTLLIGSFIAPGLMSVHGQTTWPSATITSSSLIRKTGEIRATVHIQADANAMAIWEKNKTREYNFVLLYHKVTNDNIAAKSLVHQVDKFTRSIHTSTSTRSCTKDKSTDDKDPNFTCVTGPLSIYGTYATQVVSWSPADGVAFPELTPMRFFNLKSSEITNNPNDSFDIENLKVVPSGSELTVTGDFSSTTLKELKDRDGLQSLAIRYGKVEDHLGTGGISTPFTELDDEDKGTMALTNENKSFVATIKKLDSKEPYVFWISYSEVTDVKRTAPVMLTTFVPFSVEGGESTKYALKTPVETGAAYANPIVTVTTPDAVSYRVQLGVASAPSGAAKYTCSLSATPEFLGPEISAVEGSASLEVSNPSKFTGPSSGLTPGLYCAGVRFKDKDGKEGQAKVNPPGGEYFLEIIPVGVTIPPGATLDSTANAYGCKTDGSNTTYCLLAPLPGVGDSATGKLDVATGMGDYIKTIIRLVMGLIGVLAVLMIVFGGIEYMTGTSIGEKEGGKERIQNALFGLLIALGSYMILYTINPDLTNLNIKVGEVTLGTDNEQDISASDGAVPSNLPDLANVKVPTGNAKTLATQILNTPKITFQADQHGDARSSPKQNIVDTSNGLPAWTSKRSPVGAKQVTLNEKMLAGMLAASQASSTPLSISAIAGGAHSKSSTHYLGITFDVSARASDLARVKAIGQACKMAGATGLLGPCDEYPANGKTGLCKATEFNTRSDHWNHVHCAWPR